MDGNLKITTTIREGGTIVTPHGDVDMTASPALKVELRKATSASPPPARLIIDLSNVMYMDSSGLATLVEALQTSRKNKHKLIVCSLTPRVRAIFDIAKLAMVFTIVPTLDEALNA